MLKNALYLRLSLADGDLGKNNKDESMLDILAIFDNIINKYSRKLNGEDTKQDLYVFLIKLINNIDELSIVNYEDKQVLSYFSKSLKNINIHPAVLLCDSFNALQATR